MPKTASTATATIWTTAKLTEVNRRHRRMPARAGMLGPARPTGRSMVRLAKGSVWSDPGRHGGGRPRRGERLLEVVDEIRHVLESDAHPEQAGRDSRLDELRLGQLALRRRRRVDDHRVDAAERRRELGEPQPVDHGPPGVATARDLEGEHAAGVPGTELALRDGVLGMAREA